MHHVWRIARNVAGFGLLLLGVLMLVTPGPGWAAIALGLALLAPDFRWAETALGRLKEAGNEGAVLVKKWWRRMRTGSSATDDEAPR